jgi:hypothetical protein
MKLLTAILILDLCLLAGAFGQTNSIPPLPVPQDAPDQDGAKVVRVEHTIPSVTTIRMEFYDELTNEPFTIDYTAPRRHAFAGYKIIEGIAPVGYPSQPTDFPNGVGLPMEHIALPIVPTQHFICIWDHTAQRWLGYFPYNNSGYYDFQVPAWGRWYWIGLWDQSAAEYVFSLWVGHFLVEDK